MHEWTDAYVSITLVLLTHRNKNAHYRSPSLILPFQSNRLSLERPFLPKLEKLLLYSFCAALTSQSHDFFFVVVEANVGRREVLYAAFGGTSRLNGYWAGPFRALFSFISGFFISLFFLFLFISYDFLLFSFMIFKSSD